MRQRTWRALALAVALVAGLAPVGVGSAATGDPVLINEILVSHTGTDTTEYVEFYGTPGASLGGLSLIGVESDAIASLGAIDFRMDFGPADVLGNNGFLLIGNPAGLSTNYGVTPNIVIAQDSFENSSTTYALVTTVSLTGTSVTGSETVVDAVALTDGGAGDTFFIGAPVVGPDGTFLPAGARRVANGVDTDVAADWAISDFGLGAANTPTAGTFPEPITISEVRIDQPGTDIDEYVELAGAPGASLADLTYVVIGDGTGGSGVVESVTALSGTIPSGGLFVVAESTFTLGTADLDAGTTGLNFENGDNVTHLLVRDFTGANGDDLDTNDDGTLDVTPWSSLADSVALVQALGSGDLIYSATVVGPDGAFVPGHAYRCDGGFVIGSFTAGVNDTPGAANDCAPSTPCQGVTGAVPISTIQGTGDISPCVGDRVTVQGIVVGDYEGASPTLRGFYVQEEDVDTDADPTTSEGIFVFNGSSDSVVLGDAVTVEGTVSEFQSQTQLSDFAVISVNSSGNPLPTAAGVTLPLVSAGALEAVEGMRVTMPQTLFATEFFQLGRFGMVVVSSGDRLEQPTAVAAPGAAAAAVQAANNLNRLILDDETNDQNPDPIKLSRGGTGLTAANTLRGGDTITGATGVMTYTWAGNAASGNAFRLRPAGTTFAFDPTNPRPATAPDVGGELTVASFNVLNYFLTVDTVDVCGPTQDQDCRGADTALELTRQRDKMLAALAKIGADVFGLVELENTPGVSPEQDIADGLNDLFGAGTYAAVDAGLVGTDAIRVGIVYRTDAVTALGGPAELEFSLDDLGQPRSRTALAQSFVDGDGEVVTVVVNHLKSKGASEIADGICLTTPSYADCDQGDGQAFFNDIRTRHAGELRDWLASDPTGSGDDDVLVLGDLNSYAMEDPIGVLTDAGYVDLGAGPDAYSFVFDGQWGRLDYALASPTLAPQVTGAAEYHINSDEPNVLDYNTEFKSAGQVISLYAPDEFRTSDHDPVVLGLTLTAGSALEASDVILWPPNHLLVDVMIDAGDADVTILSAVSSEADEGLNRGDQPGDIGAIDGHTIPLRAERFSIEGRVYTLTVLVSNGVSSRVMEVTVTVPHDLRVE